MTHNLNFTLPLSIWHCFTVQQNSTRKGQGKPMSHHLIRMAVRIHDPVIAPTRIWMVAFGGQPWFFEGPNCGKSPVDFQFRNLANTSAHLELDVGIDILENTVKCINMSFEKTLANMSQSFLILYFFLPKACLQRSGRIHLTAQCEFNN